MLLIEILNESLLSVPFCYGVIVNPTDTDIQLTASEEDDLKSTVWDAPNCVNTFLVQVSAEDECYADADSFYLDVKCNSPPTPVLSCRYFLKQI
jgi:hypothetical protein